MINIGLSQHLPKGRATNRIFLPWIEKEKRKKEREREWESSLRQCYSCLHYIFYLFTSFPCSKVYSKNRQRTKFDLRTLIDNLLKIQVWVKVILIWPLCPQKRVYWIENYLNMRMSNWYIKKTPHQNMIHNLKHRKITS